MSSDDRDAAVWEAIGGDPAKIEEDGKAVGGVPDEPPEWFVSFLQEFRRLQRRVSELEQGENGREKVNPNLTTLQKYAKMDSALRADTLGKTDRIAVAIYQNWVDLQEKLGDAENRRYGVSTRRNSTKKNNPSQFRIDLENIVDDELLDDKGRLSWAIIHDAMMAVATLSGGAPEHDEYGRKHITGGLFEYHEKPTPGTGDTLYKVLYET